MTSPEGGFYTAEDADSEGEEGKFYFWNYSELKKILSQDDLIIFCKVFNVEEDGNFVDQLKGVKDGNNILHKRRSNSIFANEFKISENELTNKIEQIREVLFEVREKRIHPLKDDKILTDWNGLMIAAIAKTARVLDDENFKNAAIKSMKFIIAKMKDKNGRLFHRYRDEEFSIKATLDDYAFVIWGLLELYETTFDINYLKTAVELQNTQNEYFWDEINFGYFLTANDAEKLLTRSKDIYDSAIPSGNSVSFNNLLKLGRLTANIDYENMASQMSITFSEIVNRAPIGTTMMLQGVNFALGNSSEVVIVANKENEITNELIQKLNQPFIPNKVVLLVTKQNQNELAKLAPFTKDYKILEGKPFIYVCKNYNCNIPTNEIKTAIEMLN